MGELLMFKVETTKITRVANYIEGIACIAAVAAMVFFYKDVNAYFDDLTMKIVADGVEFLTIP